MLIRHLTAGLDGAEPKTKGMPDPLSSGRREALEVKLHAWYAIYLGMMETPKAERRAGSPRRDLGASVLYGSPDPHLRPLLPAAQLQWPWLGEL